jgi:hypothetical protein
MLKRGIALGTVAAVLLACTADKPAPTALEVRAPLFEVGANSDFNLGTHLTGDEEVFTPAVPGGPTPADSRGQGQAIFRISADGSTVDFRLIASNIDNVIMSHIHCAAAGSNGGISMWLFPVIGPSGAPRASGLGRSSGVLASGRFSTVGVLCPLVGTNPRVRLLDEIRAGRTYVNVHTNDGVTGNNTGPGDFPGGELRGQIDHENH